MALNSCIFSKKEQTFPILSNIRIYEYKIFLPAYIFLYSLSHPVVISSLVLTKIGTIPTYWFFMTEIICGLMLGIGVYYRPRIYTWYAMYFFGRWKFYIFWATGMQYYKTGTMLKRISLTLLYI